MKINKKRKKEENENEIQNFKFKLTKIYFPLKKGKICYIILQELKIW